MTSKLKLILNHDKADSICKISIAYMIYGSPTRVLFLRWPHLPMVNCLKCNMTLDKIPKGFLFLIPRVKNQTSQEYYLIWISIRDLEWAVR